MDEGKHTLLLVDDDANVLKSLQRLFRQNKDITVLTAEDARSAAKLLKQAPVDLLISDERMPQIEGHKFVQYVKKNYPSIIRIILTGYADTEAMKTAVNKGEVYRYLFKPWDDNELMVTVKNALKLAETEQQRSEYARRLEEMNKSLEEKVAQRTTQLEQALAVIKKQRDTAHSQLWATARFLDSLRALIDKESRRSNRSRQMSSKIEELGNTLDFSVEVIKPAVLAAYFYKIGTLTKNSKNSVQPDREELLEKSAQLIAAVLQYSELEEAIRYSSENFDGSGGPGGLSGADIPLAARLFRVVYDYEDIRERRGVSAEEAAAFITQHKHSLYDPDIADTLYQISKGEGEVSTQRVKIAELEAGMVLAEDLYLDNGVLYLAADTKISGALHKRLQNVSSDRLFPLNRDSRVAIITR
ncbi:MAG: response regulator [Spirochaetaceae bacterium]|nr:response regulator [Spirochaetaceae bacterium]MCF7949020.1 response regulator [Spirochaetia bacterium]MCF7952221.1 response regulator [Spirochaetaceae bacterium]